MGKIIRLTEDWVSITATTTQPSYAALDVSEFDILDFVVTTGLTTSGSPSFTLSLLTGMSLQSETAWVTVPNSTLTFTSAREPSNIMPMSTLTGGFYRYVRWKASFNANVTQASFLVEGIGRSYAVGG